MVSPEHCRLGLASRLSDIQNVTDLFWLGRYVEDRENDE